MTAEREGAEVEAVLEAHRPSGRRSDHNNTPLCSCGHDLGWYETWSEHVADVLAPLIEERERLASERALRETADAWQFNLRRDAALFDYGRWLNAAAKMLRERADTYAEATDQ